MKDKLLNNRQVLNLFTNNDYNKYFKNNYCFYTKLNKQHIKLYTEEHIYSIMIINDLNFTFSNKISIELKSYYLNNLFNLLLNKKHNNDKNKFKI